MLNRMSADSGVAASNSDSPPAISRSLFRLCSVGVATLVVVLVTTIERLHASERVTSSTAPSLVAPGFVGSRTCGTCHSVQFKSWQGSHHQLAMQPATDASVLGNFNHEQIKIDEVTSTFFKRGKKFLVRTDVPDGALKRLRNRVHLRSVPRCSSTSSRCPEARLQALGIAWDASSRARSVVSDGFVSIRRPDLAIGFLCIGPPSIRPGTTCARTVIRPTFARITTSRPVTTTPHMPRSMWLAKPAMGRVRIMWRGQGSRERLEGAGRKRRADDCA